MEKKKRNLLTWAGFQRRERRDFPGASIAESLESRGKGEQVKKIGRERGGVVHRRKCVRV